MDNNEKKYKIPLDAIYNLLWDCRDLEIKMLWSRLTLLGAFMALTYTGYGVLIIKVLDKIVHWEAFNLLAIAAGCIGVLFSVLWITTAKGSKAWFERYEASIEYFQEVNEKHFEKYANGQRFLSYRDYKRPEMEQLCSPINDALFSTDSGAYSVSRIPMVMGQVSLALWICVIIGHMFCLYAGRDYMMLFVSHLGLKVACVMVISALLCVLIVCSKVRSNYL